MSGRTEKGFHSGRYVIQNLHPFLLLAFIILPCAEENVAIMYACLPLIVFQLKYLSEKIQSYLHSG